jgi:hypothetical protein
MRSDDCTEEEVRVSHTESEHTIHQQSQLTDNPERLPQNPSVEPHPEPSNEPLVGPDIKEENQRKDRDVPSMWRLISQVFISEILAIILSTGLLITIVVVLIDFSHQPQPSWK